MKARILVVDDDKSMRELLTEGLQRRGFAVVCSESADDGFTEVRTGDIDVVLTDLRMRGASGLDLCERITANRPDIPVIVITAFGSLETAVAAIRAGAYDFVTKPFELDSVVLTLERAIQYRSLREEVSRLRKTVEELQGFQEMIGESPPMRRLYELVARVARTDSGVLISGETGTGKELVARAIHRLSERSSGPFVAVNCSAMPEHLLESELFGHVTGAFTDARTARKGLFLEAHGGTLFLDEIGDMPVGLQPKILRALQERCVRRVGSQTEEAFDVRVVAASNRDLEAALRNGDFREDLFFRLNVINVEVPPLRDRGGDVLLIAQHFVARYAARTGKRVMGLLPASAQKLLNYAWPGNVRELQNCIERAIALTDYGRICPEDLPDKIRNYSGANPSVWCWDPQLVSLDEIERRYILHVLDAVGQNKALAARTLGLDRKTLYRKLAQYGATGSQGA